MSIRTKGDIVLASNNSQDLANLAMQYLTLWHKIANGYNDVTVPDKPFHIAFLPMKEVNMLTVGIFYTQSYKWQTPVYYDRDSDNWSDHIGASNVASMESNYASYKMKTIINIPFESLLRTAEEMEADIRSYKQKQDDIKTEAERLAKIQKLKNELAHLENN